MNKENVWVAIVSTIERETSPEYRALEVAGEILHVHREPGLMRVLTRTIAAAQRITELAEPDDAYIFSVQPGVLCTVKQPGDQEEMNALEQRAHLYPLGPGLSFMFISLYD